MTQHASISAGSIVAVLMPRLMSSDSTNPRNSSSHGPEIAITVNDPQQVMLVGDSPDFGVCRESTKAGKPCANIVNKFVFEILVGLWG